MDGVPEAPYSLRTACRLQLRPRGFEAPGSEDRADGYEIDYDYCKGCGICAAECTCGPTAMVPEET